MGRVKSVGRTRISEGIASPTRWMWAWASSESWWWTGRPGMLQATGSQRAGHDWATEPNWMTCIPSMPLERHKGGWNSALLIVDMSNIICIFGLHSLNVIRSWIELQGLWLKQVFWARKAYNWMTTVDRRESKGEENFCSLPIELVNRYAS